MQTLLHNRSIAAIITAFALIALSMGLAGCPTLADGAYKKDQTLYNADVAITTSYDMMQTFVSWEYTNRAALAAYPDIRKAANVIRTNGKMWITTAIALRESYAASPTEENRTALQRSLDVIRTALLEATNYMAQSPVTPDNNPE